MTDLLSLSLKELKELFPEPKYLAGQIFPFLHNGATFDEMTSLKKDLREKLKEEYLFSMQKEL